MISRRAPKSDMALSEPWYHDFSVLGFPTAQKGGIFPANQKAKEAPLFHLIDEALRRTPGDVIELFCADSLFGIYALQHGAKSLLGIDTGYAQAGGVPIHLQQARIAADALGVGAKATFEDRDVWNVEGVYDIGICAGGLYHLTDPERFLAKLHDHIRGSLVVQTVVSLENTDANYFVASPSYRPHGSCCSAAWMIAAIERAGWKILEQSQNELPGNPELYNRGSIYLLLQ